MGIFDRKPNVEKLKARKNIKGLIKALNYKKEYPQYKYEKNDHIRANAAEALGTLGDIRAIEPLMQALKEYDSSNVRIAVVEALANLGDKKAIKPLTQVLRDSDAHVWMAAAKALLRMGWKPSKKVEQVPYLIAAQEWDDLIRIGEPALEKLFQANATGLTGEKGHEVWDKIWSQVEVKRVEKDVKTIHPKIIERFRNKFPEIVEHLSKIPIIGKKEWDSISQSNPRIRLRYGERNVRLKDLSWLEGSMEEILQVLAWCGRTKYGIEFKAEEISLIQASDSDLPSPICTIQVASKETECHDGPVTWESWIAGRLHTVQISEGTYRYFFDGAISPANYDGYATFTIPKHPFDTD